MTRDPVPFVIWSIEHGAWWRPGGFGYSARLADAGRFTEAEAARIVACANRVAFHECMIPVTALRLDKGGDA